MRVRPGFWWFFLAACAGVLWFAAVVPSHAPAFLHIQLAERGTPTMQTTLVARLTDLQATPITDVQLSLRAWMTTMPMETHAISIVPKDQGIYLISIQFSMSGPWIIQVAVHPPGFLPLKQTLTLDVQSHA